MNRYDRMIAGGLGAGWAVGVLLLMYGAAGLLDEAPTCADTFKEWDRVQTLIMDCRADPDCYVTSAHLERVRDLAPRVAECEKATWEAAK